LEIATMRMAGWDDLVSQPPSREAGADDTDTNRSIGAARTFSALSTIHTVFSSNASLSYQAAYRSVNSAISPLASWTF
jgi:hypothetical protein